MTVFVENFFLLFQNYVSAVCSPRPQLLSLDPAVTQQLLQIFSRNILKVRKLKAEMFFLFQSNRPVIYSILNNYVPTLESILLTLSKHLQLLWRNDHWFSCWSPCVSYVVEPTYVRHCRMESVVLFKSLTWLVPHSRNRLPAKVTLQIQRIIRRKIETFRLIYKEDSRPGR